MGRCLTVSTLILILHVSGTSVLSGVWVWDHRSLVSRLVGPTLSPESGTLSLENPVGTRFLPRAKDPFWVWDRNGVYVSTRPDRVLRREGVLSVRRRRDCCFCGCTSTLLREVCRSSRPSARRRGGPHRSPSIVEVRRRRLRWHYGPKQ